MSPKFRMKCLFLIALFQSYSCGRGETKKSEVLDLQYENWAHKYRFNGYYEGSVRVCVKAGKGVSVSDIQTAKSNASLALFAWAKASSQYLRKIKASVTLSCADPHYIVNLSSAAEFARVHRKDLRAFVHPDRANQIEVNTSDLSYTLFLHEFGHAFVGLGDTYIDDGSGRCKKGQPASIMCSHVRFGSNLMQDDLNGLWKSISQTYSTYLLAGGFSRIYWEPLARFEVKKNLLFSDLEYKLSSIGFVDEFPQTLYVDIKSIKKINSGCNLPDDATFFKWDALDTYVESINSFREFAKKSIVCQ